MLTYERTFGGYVILNKVKNLKIYRYLSMTSTLGLTAILL